MKKSLKLLKAFYKIFQQYFLYSSEVATITQPHLTRECKVHETERNNRNNHEYKRVVRASQLLHGVLFSLVPPFCYATNKFKCFPDFGMTIFSSQVHVHNCARCNLKIILHGSYNYGARIPEMKEENVAQNEFKVAAKYSRRLQSSFLFLKTLTRLSREHSQQLNSRCSRKMLSRFVVSSCRTRISVELLNHNS